MEEETTQTTQQETTEQTPAAKTYNDDEVNGIVKKSKLKARADALKELGLTGEDEAWAKEAIAAAKAKKAAQKPTSDRESELSQQLAAIQSAHAQAAIEAQFLRAGTDPVKAARAVRLVDPAKCCEDGKFSSEKAAAEVKSVLQEFPELAATQQSSKKAGADMSGSGQSGGNDTLARIFGNKK